MTTLLISHPSSLAHVTPPGHPERVDRIKAVSAALADSRFAPLLREEAITGTWEQVASCHPGDYGRILRDASPDRGLVQIDSDTFMSPGTIEAALNAVGAAVQAVDAVMSGRAKSAFCALRPPGHHAESKTAMGFCFFNNAAIAARHAQAAHGAERVAIMDWDVHHGNGTQEIFWADASVMYASTHEMPLYPGTGAASERGEHGTVVNAPLRAGDGSAAFRDVFTRAILPRIDDFAPDLIVISAGFDAHANDPLANLELREGDFAWATRELMAIAVRRCGGRIVSVLEGGYDLAGLSGSAAAHVAALMEG